MVSNDKTKDVYICNGSQKIFPITFQTLRDDYGNAKHFAVHRTDSNGNTYQLVKGADYSVSGLNIVTTAAYPQGDKISMVRKMELTQLTDLVRTGRIDPETLEQALDKLTFITQELKEKLERAFLAPVSIEAVQAVSIDAILSLQSTIQAMVHKARDWASKAENEIVEGGVYSALHYASKCQQYWTQIATYIAEAARVYVITLSTDAFETIKNFSTYSVPEGNYSAYVQLRGNNTRNVHHVAVELSTTNITIRIYHVDNDSALPQEGPPPIKFGQKKLGAFVLGSRQTIQMTAFLR